MGLPRDDITIDPAQVTPTGPGHCMLDSLQFLSTLVRLQIRQCETDEARSRLLYVLGAVTNIGRLQQNLDGLGGDTLRTHLSQAIGLWCEMGRQQGVQIHVSLDGGVTVPPEVVLPSALIAQELVSNCLEHAFPDGRGGSIMISLKSDGAARASITVEDDGAGFDAPPGGCAGAPSLGLSIVRSLALGAGAEFAFHSARREGAIARLRFACPA